MRFVAGLFVVGLFVGCTTAPPEPIVVEIPNLTLSVVETFDRGSVGLNPTVYHDRWGERLLSTEGEIRLAEGAGVGGTNALAHDYAATFDKMYDPIEFHNTDVMFDLTFEMRAAEADATGITLEINPGNASFVSFVVREHKPDNYDTYSASVVLQRNMWSTIVLPFSLFMPDGDIPSFDPSKPFLLEISVPYEENAVRRSFDYNPDFSGTTLVDNIGYYTRSTPSADGLIAAFDDAETGAAITVDLYESSLYVDYTTDEGEAVVTPGVRSLVIDVNPETPGASGKARGFDITMETDSAFDAYLDAGRQLVVSGRIQLALPESGTELVFSVRSDTLDYGDLDLYATGLYEVYREFSLGGFWTDVVIPLDPDRPAGAHAYIDYRAPVSDELMEQIRSSGTLNVDIAFDEFRVQ